MKLVLLSLVLFVLCVGFVTAVSCGDTISVNTVLTEDLTDCLGNGLIVDSSGRTLDCNGHTIDGTGVGKGIILDGRNSVTIKNCNIKEFDYGIYVNNCYSSGNHNIIRGNIIKSYGTYGIYLKDAYTNVYDNIISNNIQGIFLQNVQASIISGNRIDNNANYGLYLTAGSSSNRLWNNGLFNNGLDNAYETSDSNGNSWNYTEFGNAWSDYSGSGVYEISGDGDGIDYYPTFYNDVNFAPTINPPSNLEGYEDQTLYIDLNVTDPNNENAWLFDDDVLTCTSPDAPEGLTIENCNVIWTPNVYQAGNYEVTFTVSDGEYEDSATATITVLNTPASDLTLTNEDIIFSNNNPKKNETVTITATFDQIMEIDPDPIVVNFYDGDPLNGGILIGSDTITRGFTLGSYFAQTNWQATEPIGTHDIYVFLDPANEIVEGNESNNLAYTSLNVRMLPDLLIRPFDIGFTKPGPQPGEQISILAMVHNTENMSTGNFTVLFYLNNMANVISEETLNLGPDNTRLLIVPWTAVGGEHTIYVRADLYNTVEELNENNDEASKTIIVDSTIDDYDGDGTENTIDNCPFLYNPSQGDLDNDGVGDYCDNCVLTKNANQIDSDSDGIGDKCEGLNYRCTAISVGQLED